MKLHGASDERDTAHAYLVSLDTSSQYREYPVTQEESRIGRDSKMCNIVLSGTTVSREHCAIGADETGRFRISDLNSLNGLYVNGQRFAGTRYLEQGDIIGLGTAQPGHFRFQLESQGDSQRSFRLNPGPHWTIGRDPANDISMPFESTASSRHAEVHPRNGCLEVADQKSLNGTWVNGVRTRRALLEPTDSVIIGATIYQFRLLDDGGLQVNQRETGSRFELECIDLTQTVGSTGFGHHPGKRILDSVNISIRPGEFVGVLGPSGAGKSTLLKALNGYAPPSTGCVLINQSPLYQSFEMFRSSIGYVPQDDIIHNELTVEDSLNFIALLRLPPDVTEQQRIDLVDTTIESLGLSHVRKNHIYELSGGQRKRVSIGAELITRPSILFLDEPTSGMDPSTEEKLMYRFKDMASRGTTVLITTHILYNLDLLDRIIILARGKLVFFGTPSEARTFFSPDGKALERPTRIFDLLEGEDSGSVTDLGLTRGGDIREEVACHYAAKYRRSALYKKHVLEQYSDTAKGLVAVAENTTVDTPAKDTTTVANYRALLERPVRRKQKQVGLDLFNLRYIGVLAKRVANIKLVNLKRAAFYFAVPVVLALVTLSLHTGKLPDDRVMAMERTAIDQQIQAGPGGLGPALKSLFSSQGVADPRTPQELVYSLKFEGVANLPISMSVLLMFVMTAVFTGTLMACMDISGERPVYVRERMAGQKIGDYLVSKLPFLFSLTAAQSLLFLGICFLKPELRQVDFLSAYAALVAMAWASCALGLFLSAADPTPGYFSTVLAIVAVLPQLVLSGGLGPDYFQDMSVLMQGFADLLPARWGLEMLMTAFFYQPEVQSLQWVEGFVENTVGFGFGHRVIVINLWILVLHIIMWLLLAAFLLKRQDKVR